MPAKSFRNIPALVPGMVKEANTELWDRTPLLNDDGSTSTTSSISIGTDDGEVLIPTVVDGVRLTEDEAIEHYRKTGQHLGIFSSVPAAEDYSVRLHNEQARRMGI